jgi:hypothetical protein
MKFRLVQELAADGVRVAVACRMLRVSTSGYYEWRERPPSLRTVADQTLTVQIKEIHTCSRGTYGAPRVHAGTAAWARPALRPQAGGPADASREPVRYLPAASLEAGGCAGAGA